MPLDFTAVDLEWVANQGAAICSVGAVRFRDGKPQEAFDVKVRPQTPYSQWEQWAIKKNHVTFEDVMFEPEWCDIYDDFLDFTGEDVLAFHNAKSADLPHLEKACDSYDLAYRPFDYLCTYSLSKLMFPNRQGKGKHTLSSMCKAQGIDWNASLYHTAAYDAQKCGELLVSLARLVNASTLQDISRGIAFRNVVSDKTIPTDMRSVIEAMPDATIEEWINALYETPANPGDKCRMCDQPLSSKARKQYRPAHCCTAPCWHRLEQQFEQQKKLLDQPPELIRPSYS
ncbi:exonuclease domain-containing protein [Bifidobacterium samirii]|uniref:DNA polymerase III subunit epsilon n=1 Tax=Bifidobacterium samirii TaxID=2306974 RepID=A0A430FWH2_9BIFI|nr:exonuclease domain-containing protein [Bifidobacterium samirii]RSX58711.1 DNA polymerase III subunit epsilon [Bifidobacterium samirii]